MSIREYIKNNFKDSTEEEITSSIEEAIKGGEEEALPGLGVFFDIVWNSSSESEKEMMVKKIKSNQ